MANGSRSGSEDILGGNFNIGIDVDPFSDTEPSSSKSEVSLPEKSSKVASSKDFTGAKMGLLGAKFAMDYFNAQSQYDHLSAKAATNIFLARQQASDIMTRGKEAAFKLQNLGQQRSDKAAVELAAQGIDLSSSGAQRILESQESIGLMNAMIAEINASKDALALDFEIAQLDASIDRAKLERDLSIASSALNFGIGAAGLL